MKETIIEVITPAERRQLAGRFCTVDAGEGYRVIGTVGSLRPQDLSRRQKHFLATLHFLDESGTYSFETLPSYPNSRLPENNFNGFLLIRKE